MYPFTEFLEIKCFACKEPLIRIAQSEANDHVVCPVCWAAGGYKQVIEKSGGLSRSYFLTDDFKNLVEQARLKRDSAL